MTSYRANHRENHADSNSFDSDVYAKLLLHPMVRSLMLEHSQKESMVESGYYKLSKPSFHTQRRKESKGEYKRKRVTFGTHIQLNREESKEAVEHRNDRDLNGHQAHTSRSDWCINQERIHTYNRVRESHQDRIEPLAGTNTTSFGRDPKRSLSLDRNGQDTEERITAPHRRRELHQERIESLPDTNRPSFQRAGTRRLSHAQDSQDNQESINISTQESELYQERTECLDNIDDPMLLKSALRYRSLNSDSEGTFFRETVLKYRDLLRHYEARRLQRQSERLGIEYRPLLHLDTGFDDRGTSGSASTNSPEEVERLCKRVRQHVSMIRRRIHSTQHDMDPDVGWEEFKESSTPEDKWAEFTSEFCKEVYQDPGDLPSLSRDTAANESVTDPVAFDPFPCKRRKTDE